jgi:hypothetical protein
MVALSPMTIGLSAGRPGVGRQTQRSASGRSCADSGTTRGRYGPPRTRSSPAGCRPPPCRRTAQRRPRAAATARPTAPRHSVPRTPNRHRRNPPAGPGPPKPGHRIRAPARRPPTTGSLVGGAILQSRPSMRRAAPGSTTWCPIEPLPDDDRPGRGPGRTGRALSASRPPAQRGRNQTQHRRWP